MSSKLPDIYRLAKPAGPAEVAGVRIVARSVPSVPTRPRLLTGRPVSLVNVSSPAERFARARRVRVDPVAEFAAGMPFELDDFQLKGCQALADGHSVLVAAPTGSGKTVVGEFAVHRALATGTKCFYTTPIKALSNQKYNDLVDAYGAETVGLLTGDNSINSDAPVVVMTTEVLRNMLYAGSATLDSLGFVVMDEVHYLADRSRGVVWEEVIIHLPAHVALAALSATVSNVEEFGAWLRAVRGEVDLVVSERRPVPLHQHVMVDTRLVNLFADAENLPGGGSSATAVNPRLRRLAEDEVRVARMLDSRRGGPRGRQAHRAISRGASSGGNSGKAVTNGSGKAPSGGGAGGGGLRFSHHTPDRVDVVTRLAESRLLPAIAFIFSRAGCDAAVEQLRTAGVHLTTDDERAEIVRYAEERCAVIPDEDLNVLGYHDWLSCLEDGFAAHHAGVLPTLKEVVEELFARGLVKVVFATETLALGINMPARTVVLERLSKWNGQGHADITAGEYTQLTGRAGRRGIDVEGHAVVLWQAGLDPDALAGLASTRTYPLRSSFTPSYGMAVNLVRGVGRERARGLLDQSFAQFQTDRDVVGLVRRSDSEAEAAAGYAAAAACHLGNSIEYHELREQLEKARRAAGNGGAVDRRSAVADSLRSLRVGDVVVVPRGRRSGPAVVLEPVTDGTAGGPGCDGPGSAASDRLRPAGAPEPRVLALGIDRHVRRLSAQDFAGPIRRSGSVRVPGSFDARDARSRKELAASLRGSIGRDTVGRTGAERDGDSREDRSVPSRAADDAVARLEAAVRSHPGHGCPDRANHLKWARRYTTLMAEVQAVRDRVARRTDSVARVFDRVCAVLTELDYLHADRLTESGALLTALYTEADLLAAQCLRAGVWEGLDPGELVSCLSALTFQARRERDSPPRLPPGAARDALAATVSTWADLADVERRHGVRVGAEPDVGFTWACWRWAEGASLSEVLAAGGLSPGDFIRQIRQVIDLADQVGNAAAHSGRPALATAARAGVDALRRGVVAYTATV
jgi:ATP-dependent RNA helicase HelY